MEAAGKTGRWEDREAGRQAIWWDFSCSLDGMADHYYT